MAKHSVLVADADPRSLRILEVALRKAGLSVGTASDGAEALRRIQRTPPDLILAEAQLPGTDGFALCKAVRADGKLSGLPFLLMSADRTPSVKLRATELGADDFLTKPLLIKELVTRVRMLLEQREHQRMAQRGAPAAGMSGSLADMGLVDLLQSLDKWKKSGTVTCTREGRPAAQIWVREGQIVDAEAGALGGEPAVYRLLNWDDGLFSVEFGVVERDRRIDAAVNTQALLHEGVRRLDELARLAERLPMKGAFAVDHAALLQQLGDLPDEVNGVIRLFDGRRTVEQVLQLSPLDDLSTLAIVERLVAERVLLRSDAPKPTARPSLQEWLGGSSGTTGAMLAPVAPPAAESTPSPSVSSEPAPPQQLLMEPAAGTVVNGSADRAEPLPGQTARFSVPAAAELSAASEFDFDVTDKVRVPASLLKAEEEREKAKAAKEAQESEAAARAAAQSAPPAVEPLPLVAEPAPLAALVSEQQPQVAPPPEPKPEPEAEPKPEPGIEAKPPEVSAQDAPRAIERVLFPPLRGVRRERLRREAEDIRAAISAGRPVRLVHAVEMPPWAASGAPDLPPASSRRVSPAVSDEAKSLTPVEMLFLPHGRPPREPGDEAPPTLADRPAPANPDPIAAAPRAMIDDRSDAAIESAPIVPTPEPVAEPAAEPAKPAEQAAPPEVAKPVEPSAPPAEAPAAPPPPEPALPSEPAAALAAPEAAEAPKAVEPSQPAEPPKPAEPAPPESEAAERTAVMAGPITADPAFAAAPLVQARAPAADAHADITGESDRGRVHQPDAVSDEEARAASGGNKKRWLYVAALAAVGAVWFFTQRGPPSDKKDAPWIEGKDTAVAKGAAAPAAKKVEVSPSADASAVVSKGADASMAEAPQAEQAEPARVIETPPPPAKAPPPKRADDYTRFMTSGEALLKRGKYSQAVGEFKKAVKANANSVPALLALGDAYLEADQHKNALEYLEKAARLDPKNGRAQLLLGTAHQSLQHNKEAAGAYQRYLELEPAGEFARDVRSILANLQR